MASTLGFATCRKTCRQALQQQRGASTGTGCAVGQLARCPLQNGGLATTRRATPNVGAPQLDHQKRRRDKDVKEIAEAARKHGLSQADVEARLQDLRALLPDLAPNLDRMRASDWALLLRDVQRVGTLLITLKACYPGANAGRIVALAPKTLLKDPAQLAADAVVVRRALNEREDIDAIIEAVPNLVEPSQLAQSLANIKKWYNTPDPVGLLAKNPKVLLNVEEADIEADPLYGDEIYVEDVGKMNTIAAQLRSRRTTV